MESLHSLPCTQNHTYRTCIASHAYDTPARAYIKPPTACQPCARVSSNTHNTSSSSGLFLSSRRGQGLESVLGSFCDHLINFPLYHNGTVDAPTLGICLWPPRYMPMNSDLYIQHFIIFCLQSSSIFVISKTSVT
jgi:hypothetical protein